MSEQPVRIALSRDEAMVLHEWLSRVVDDENAAGLREASEDDAEIWALNAVFVLLEAALTEPFEPGHDKRLKAAAKRIRTAAGPWPWDAG